MRMGFVGCGYVAEQYANCLRHHPELTLTAAYDTNPQHLASFAARTNARAARDLDELLSGDVELIVNLTNPRAHLTVNRAAIAAGKHVYSEKPLAMTVSDAESLAALANDRGVVLASAPCSVLSECAQTLWHAVRHDAVGPIRLVYANFDDGMIAPNLQPWNWRNDAGVPWPAKDEFEVGCTFEHAGYVLTWLCAMFGPAVSVTSFASVCLPDKGIAVDGMAPDFTVGCIEFAGGVVARVTCGLVAPRDKSILVVGDAGELFVGNVRDDAAPVMRRHRREGAVARVLRRLPSLRGFLEARGGLDIVNMFSAEVYPSVAPQTNVSAAPGKRVDFLRGPAEVAAAVAEQRACRLSADFGVHLVELINALQHPAESARHAMRTTFAPMRPMPWAA